MKKFIMTVAIAGFLAIAGSAQAATFVYEGGLIKTGSMGTKVADLQTCMNGLGHSTGIVDGAFGMNTKAGVMSFQASKGVKVDGVIGPVTGPLYTAACATGTTVYPEGCTSLEGYSTVTGDACNSGTTVTLPEGCTSTTGFSPVTGVKCDGTTVTPEPGITGEEGLVESVEIKAGDDDNLFSDKDGQKLFEIEVEVEDDGSDIAVKRFDLEFTVTGDETKNYKVLDKVAIVDFASKDTDSKDDWRSDDVTVRLSGDEVVIKTGEKKTFVVELDVDEFDKTTGQTIELTSVEVLYIDGLGLYSDASDTTGKSISYDAASGFALSIDEDDDQEDKIAVELDGDKDGVLLADLDLEVDEDVLSGNLEEVTVKLELEGAAFANKAEAEDYISTLYFEIDGDTFDAEVEADGKSYVFDISDLKKLDAKDKESIKITADMEDQSDLAVFASKMIQVVEVKFDGVDSDDEDLVVADFTYTVAGTEVSTSLGDLAYKITNLEKFNDADHAGYITFDVKVTNDSGATILAADLAITKWTFDVEGVSLDADTDTIVLEEDGTAVANLADDENETYTIKLTFDAESDKDLSVVVEEINAIVVVEE